MFRTPYSYGEEVWERYFHSMPAGYSTVQVEDEFIPKDADALLHKETFVSWVLH